MSYTKIFSGGLVDTQRVRFLLESHGVYPIVKDATHSALLSGFGALQPNYLEVFVRKDQLSKAQQIIA